MKSSLEKALRARSHLVVPSWPLKAKSHSPCYTARCNGLGRPWYKGQYVCEHTQMLQNTRGEIASAGDISPALPALGLPPSPGPAPFVDAPLELALGFPRAGIRPRHTLSDFSTARFQCCWKMLCSAQLPILSGPSKLLKRA